MPRTVAWKLGLGLRPWLLFQVDDLRKPLGLQPVASEGLSVVHRSPPLWSEASASLTILEGEATVVLQKSCRDATKMSAEATVEEARFLAHKLVEFEKGHCGGDTELALYRASTRWGVDESALKSLRYRWRTLKFVKAHILDRLRQVDAVLQTRSAREREILQETAETLERAGSSAAGLARYAAEMARSED